MSRNQIEDLITCPICLDRFNQPKMLPCQHTFCMSCLGHQVRNLRICCPICREMHKVPGNGVGGFPNNLTMIGLLDLPAQQQSTPAVVCQECSKRNCIIRKCHHCENALCRGCLEKHSLKLKEELKQSTSKVRRRIPGISQRIKTVQEYQKRLQENERTAKTDVTECIGTIDRCIAELQTKKTKLADQVKNFVLQQNRVLGEKRESLETELVLVTSFCDTAEMLSTSITASDDMSQHQTKIIEMIKQSEQHLKRAVIGNAPGKCIEVCTGESRSIAESISKFQGIKIRTNLSVHENTEQSRDTSDLAAVYMSENVARRIDPHYLRYKTRAKRVIGLRGDNVTSFDHPRGIAVTADDRIVVADTGNDRIQVINILTNDVRKFGSHGIENGMMHEPWDVCVTPAGQIAVADKNNRRMQIFNDNGKFLKAIQTTKLCTERGLGTAWSVSADSDGVKYVTCSRQPIILYAPDGTFVRSIGESNSLIKYLTVTDDKKVVVSDSDQHSISVFDESGECIMKIGREGSNYGEFQWPKGVACDRNGNIFVADCGNHRIQIFNKEGDFISSFGREGSLPGEFKYPRGVAVLSNGDFVVCDTDNNRIQIF